MQQVVSGSKLRYKKQIIIVELLLQIYLGGKFENINELIHNELDGKRNRVKEDLDNLENIKIILIMKLMNYINNLLLKIK